MKVSHRFLAYFLFVSLAMLCGIGLALLHGIIVNPDPKPMNTTEIEERYQFQTSYKIPYMQKVFPLLTVFNIGVSIIIVLFPLYWIWIVRYSSNLLTPDSVPMKGTVYFLIMAVGHNTFYKTYIFYKTLPPSIFGTMLYPHAILEIFAYILAGVISLLCIDEVRAYMKKHDCLQDLHPGDLSIFILHRTWIGIIFIAVLILIAGYIECYITPSLVASSISSYLGF